MVVRFVSEEKKGDKNALQINSLLNENQLIRLWFWIFVGKHLLMAGWWWVGQ